MLSKTEIEKITSVFYPEWYCSNYPDVSLSGMNPLEHYLSVGLSLGRNPGPSFDSLKYTKENGLEDESVLPLQHFLGISAPSNGILQASASTLNNLEPIHGYVDFPVEGELVGHDYIRIIGWCYLCAQELESVRAEIVDSKKNASLRFGIFRPDVAAVFPNLKLFNVGFEGEIFPYFKSGSEPELRVVARSCSGLVYEMRKKLKGDPTFVGKPVNRSMAASELAQTLNGEILL
jgi:hypothetical protein